MITTDITEHTYKTNLHRPDITEDTVDRWSSAHEWIKTCEIPIAVSSAFYMIEDCISESQWYLGGGFQYCFWFRSEEDQKIFEEKMKELLV